MTGKTSRTLLAMTALLLLVHSNFPALANPPGNNWGPLGITTTDSALTVQWNNGGATPSSSKVDRSDDAAVPYTQYKYRDLRQAYPGLAQEMQERLGNAKIQVSQSRYLTNQSIMLNFTGLGSQLEIFQCWGDSTQTNPDPMNCAAANRRQNFDWLAINADYGPQTYRSPIYLPGTQERINAQLPFRSVDGRVRTRETIKTTEARPPSYSIYTPDPRAGFNGSIQTRYEVQTGMELPGLGCGFKKPEVGQPLETTSVCWLVAVPINTLGHQGPTVPGWAETAGGGNQDIIGPLSPSMWMHRFQIKLDFLDLPAYCDGSGTPIVGVGSELVADAVASWLPWLCQRGQRYSQSTVKDPLARRMQAQGTAVIATSEPSPGAVHIPIANAAAVITFNAIRSSSGELLPQLRLNPRLIAKMLTQSYQPTIQADKTAQVLVAKEVGFYPELAENLSFDQEFRDLNPEFIIKKGSETQFTLNLDPKILLESAPSDASRAIWRWLMADREARSFLSGCPSLTRLDRQGRLLPFFVHPFYSLRTFEGCEKEAQENNYAAREEQFRRQTTSKNYSNAVPVFVTDDNAYPLMDWYTYNKGMVNEKNQDVRDPSDAGGSSSMIFPRYESPRQVGQYVARGQYRERGSYCEYRAKIGGEPLTHSDCIDQLSDTDKIKPDFLGGWTGGKVAPANFSNPEMQNQLGMTDTVTAARYGLKTAQLCQGTALDTCTSATTATIASGIEGFKTVEGFPDAPQQLLPVPQGVYPLALPIYLAVKGTKTGPDGGSPKPAISDDELDQLGKIATSITTDGQIPGTASGQLPPGYVPLTNVQRQLAAAGIAKLPHTNKIVAQPKPTNLAVAAPVIVQNDQSGQRMQRSLTTIKAPSGNKRSTQKVKVATQPQIAAKAGLTGAVPSPWWAKAVLILMIVGALCAVVAPILEVAQGSEK